MIGKLPGGGDLLGSGAYAYPLSKGLRKPAAQGRTLAPGAAQVGHTACWLLLTCEDGGRCGGHSGGRRMPLPPRKEVGSLKKMLVGGETPLS